MKVMCKNCGELPIPLPNIKHVPMEQMVKLKKILLKSACQTCGGKINLVDGEQYMTPELTEMYNTLNNLNPNDYNLTPEQFYIHQKALEAGLECELELHKERSLRLKAAEAREELRQQLTKTISEEKINCERLEKQVIELTHSLDLAEEKAKHFKELYGKLKGAQP